MSKTKEGPRESPTGNSFLTAFTECPKKWAFKYLMQWIPEKSKVTKDYFVFGQAFHLFKELFYTNPDEKNPFRFVETGLTYIDDNSNGLDDETINLLKERLPIAVEIWLKEFSNDHERYEVIGAEMDNVLVLPNNFKLSVRYDTVLRERSTGFVYVFDTKTTRAPLSDMIEKYRYSAQPFIYCASIMQSDYAWKSDFRGWITDAIYQKKFVRDGWRTAVKRSEVVFYTEKEVQEFLKSLTLLTDEMLFCSERFLKDGESLGESFRMDRNKCFQKFNGLCPYYHDCLKGWSKNDSSNPPESYSKDLWTGFDAIQTGLSGIFKNETKTN